MRKVQILGAVVLTSLLGAVAVGQLYDHLPYGAPPRGGPYWIPEDGMPVDVSDFRGEILVVASRGSDGQQVISGLLKPRVRHIEKCIVGEDIVIQGVGHGPDVGISVGERKRPRRRLWK